MKKWILVVLALLFSGSIFISCSDDNSSEPGNSLPSCEIITPADSALFYGDQIITINVKAEDVDGNIYEVRLYIDDIGYAMDDEFPYSFIIPADTLSIDSHKITAEAEDNEGAERTSSEITINIGGPITFLDTVLEQTVRSIIHKPTGLIYPTDVDNLISFYGENLNIVNISGMEYFINLEQLLLMDNLIDDITPLENLTRLTQLYLSDNQIIDISPVENLTDLTVISFISNKISDISSLSNLTNLTTIFLSDNQISDITSLSNLTNLTDISLHTNQIIDISALSNLTNLDFVSLEYNQITDIYPLVQNTGISDGVTVRLTGNPLDSTSINTYIPQLEARGVTVYF